MPPTADSYAFGLIAAREYSERDLRRKLVRREYEPSDVEATIARLVERRLIDDARYAEVFARQRLAGGGVAARRVVQELIRRGIDRAGARDAVAKVSMDEEVDVAEGLERVARKKLVSLGEADPEVLRRRTFGYLARRGFELDDIKQVVGKLLP